MFFMGGMTLGYLHPPVSAKAADGAAVAVDEKIARASVSPAGQAHAEGKIERTLLWARRILC